MTLVQDKPKRVLDGPALIPSVDSSLKKDSIQPILKQPKGTRILDVPEYQSPINDFVPDTDNPEKPIKVPSTKDDETNLSTIDDEIQKLTEESRTAWDEFKKSIDPNETPEERQRRLPNFKPWSEQKAERELKIAKLKVVRRTIIDKKTPTTPEMENDVISSIAFKQDSAGHMINNYAGIVNKIGLPKYNRIDRETQDRDFDAVAAFNLHNEEKAGNTLALYNFKALTDKPLVPPEDQAGLKKLLDDAQKDPEFSGVGKISGMYNYETKKKRIDQLVKKYVDQKFKDLEPDARKNKYADYAKTMNAIMTVDMNDGSLSMYGLKSYTESIADQLKARYDEVSAWRDQIHNAEFPADKNNLMPLQKLLGQGPDFKMNYENFQAYKDRIENEYETLKGALEFSQKILKTPEQKRGIRDLAKGLGRDNLLTDILTLGIDEMQRTLKVGEIANKMNGESGYYEPTWAEAKIMEMYSVMQEAQSKGTVGDISTIGHGVTNMIPYIVTFGATRFAFKGAQQVFKAGISGVSDAVLGSMKPSIIKSMTVNTTPFLAKTLGKTEINFAKYISDYTAKAMAAGVQTAALPQYLLKNIAEREMPRITTELNEDFTDVITQIDRNTTNTKGEAIYKGAMDSYFEILTEYGGRHFMKMAKLPLRGVKALAGKDVAKAIVLNKYFELKGIKSFRQGVQNVIEKGLGWHGIREEYLEELANQLAVYATTGDRPDSFKDFMHNQLVTFGTVGLFGGFMKLAPQAGRIARFGFIGDDIVYTQKDPLTKKKSIIRLPNEFHKELLKIFQEGEFIDDEKWAGLIEAWNSKPNKKDNLTKEQNLFVEELTLQASQQKMFRNLAINAAKKAGHIIQEQEPENTITELKENQKLLTKEDIDKITKKNKQYNEKYSDLISHGLMPQDDTGQFIEPTPEYLAEQREILKAEVDKANEKDSEGNFKQLSKESKERIKELKFQKLTLNPVTDTAKIRAINQEIEDIQKTVQEPALEARTKLQVIEDQLDIMADELGLSFNYKLPSEKHSILHDELSQGKVISGKADMITDVKMLITLPDGRRVYAFTGPEPGIDETEAGYKKRMNIIADDILLKKSPVELELVRKEDWNPEDKAARIDVDKTTGELVSLPYGDKINVKVNGKTIAAVQITDYNEENLRKAKYAKAKELFYASAGDILDRIANNVGAKHNITDDQKKKATKVLTDLAVSIADMAQIKISEAIDWIRRFIDEYLTYTSEEKQYMKDLLARNEDIITTYLEHKRLAAKGWAKEPKTPTLQDLIFESTEGVTTSSAQKVDMHLKTFFPIWKDIAWKSGFAVSQIVRRFYHIANLKSFENVTNEETYKNWLQEQRNGDLLTEAIINTIENFPYSTAISIFNFYSNVTIAKQVGVIIDKQGRVRIDMLNKSDLYSDFLYNLNRNIERLGIGRIKDKVRDYKVSSDKKFSHYKELTSEERIALKKQQFEDDLNFLQEITGIQRELWRQYFNEETKETYSFASTTDKSMTNFKTMDSLMEHETYRQSEGSKIDRFGNPYFWFQNTLVFNLLKNKEVRPDPVEGLTNDQYLTVFRKFFTEGDEGRNVLSNLYKLATSLKDQDNIGLDGKNVKSDRFSSFIQYSDFFDTAINILDTTVDNPLTRFYIQSGKKMEVTLLNGIHNRSINNNREGNTVDEMNTEDLWVSLLSLYGKGTDTYLHNVGQFSDKPTIYLIDASKYKDITPEQRNIVVNLLGGKVNYDKIILDIKKNIIALNIPLFSEYAIGKHRPGDNTFAEFDNFVDGFVINHVLNTADTQELFFGKFESYEKNGMKPRYIDLVKRAGSSNSPGYRMNTHIEGGLDKIFTFAVANEQTLPKLGVKESINGQIFMRGKGFADKAQISMGDVYSKSVQYPILDSLKAVMSFKHKDTNLRELTKANIINIDVLAELLGGIYQEIKDFMDSNKIDILSMPSSSKTHSGTDIIQLFDSEGKINKNITIDPAKHIEDRETSTLYVQQDLRHPTIAKTTSMPSQFLTNMFTLNNSGQIIGYISELQRIGLEKLRDRVGTSDEKKNEFLKKNINDFTQPDLKKLLDNGLTIDDPAYRNFMHTVISASISKLALDIPINRLTTQEIADAEGILKPLRKTKDGKHTLLPEIITGIEGAREAKLFKGTYDQALAYITVHADEYQDLLDSPWELEEVEGGINIPGEPVISTRVPADGLHSHTVARLKKNIVGHNFTMLDRVSQEASGSDFDGDYRFNQVFFKKDGRAITDIDKAEGIANEIMMLVVKSYTEPELFDSIIRAIDTKAYDKIVENLRSKESLLSENRLDPNSFFDARLNNMVGVVMKGIMTDHMTTFSLLNRYKLKVKSPLRLIYDTKENLQIVNLDRLAQDEYGAMKAHLSNLLNLSFDNAKDPKIETMGLNEITANMFIMSMIANSKNSSENFKNFKDNYDVIYNSIEGLTSYFTSPVIKRFVFYKRRQAGGLRDESNDLIKLRLYQEAESGTEFTKGDVDNMFELWYASSELSDMRTLYRLTQEGPKTYSDYINARHVVRKIRNQNPKTGGMRYFDTRPLFVEDKDDPARMRFVTELAITEKVLLFSQDHVFNDIIEESSPGKQIFTYLFKILQKQNPNMRELSKKDLNVFSNSLSKVFDIRALGYKKNYYQTKRDIFKLFPLLKNEFIEGLSEEERKENKKKYSIYEGNEFLNNIRFVEREIQKEDQPKKTAKTIGIRPEYAHSKIPDAKLNQIRADFDKLPEEIQDLFAAYVGYEYGFLNSSSNGGFFYLFGDKYRVELSRKMSEEKEKWLSDDFTSLEKYRIAKWMQRTISNRNVRDEDSGVTYSSIIDYYNEPLIKSPVSTDALESIESINNTDKAQIVEEYTNILLEHGIKGLNDWIKEVLGISSEDTTKLSISGHAKSAIKLFRERQEQKAKLHFPNEDQTENPVRSLIKGDVHTEAMITNDPGLQDRIYSFLKKQYPDLRLFTDRDTFYNHVRLNGNRLKDVNLSAIGHAFKNAIFINPDSDIQEIIFHEMSHIYWDHLPAEQPEKKKLRDLYREFYPADQYDLNELDEMIIFDIGHVGTEYATKFLDMSRFDRFLELLRDFWRQVKIFFGKYSGKDLVTDMVRNIYTNKDGIKLETIEGHAEVKNLVLLDKKDHGIDRDKSAHSCRLGNIELPGITSVIKKFEYFQFDPDETASMSIEKFKSSYKKVTRMDPTPKMIEDELEGLKLKWAESGIAGTDIHAIAEAVFMDKSITDQLTSRFTTKEVLAEYVKTLNHLKAEILAKYPQATFYAEQDLISLNFKLFGIADLIVDIGNHELIVFDFKTTDKEFKDKDNKETDDYTKNYGMLRSPVSNLKQSKKTKHILQLSIEAAILEEQENEIQKGEKNKVVGLYVVPIMREVDENGLISKARISNIVEEPGTEITYALKNSVKIAYEKDLAIGLLTKFAEVYKDLEASFPEFDFKLKQAGVSAPIRKELMSAESYLSTVSTVPLSEITHGTLQDIRNNGLRSRHRKFVMDLGYDSKDYADYPFELFLFLTDRNIQKRQYLESKKTFFKETKVGANTKRVLNPKLTEEQQNRTYYHTNIDGIDIYSHEVGTKNIKKDQKIVEIYEVPGAKKKYKEFRIFTVTEINHRYKWVRVKDDETNVEHTIYQVAADEGVLAYDETPDKLRHTEKENFVQRYISIEEPIMQEHWVHNADITPENQASEGRLWRFFGEYDTREKILKLMNNYDEMVQIYHDLANDDISKPLREFLGEVLVNHDMAEQIRTEHKFGPSSMMPMTLNVYYMLTRPEKEIMDLDGWWKQGYYWQPARMMSSEYTHFNYLMYGLEKGFRKAAEEQYVLRHKLARFMLNKDNKDYPKDFDIDNVVSTKRGHKHYVLPNTRNLSESEKDFLEIIYNHYYTFVSPYVYAKKQAEAKGQTKYPMLIPVTKVFATREEMQEDPTIGRSWGGVLHELLQPSIYDDTHVQLVERVDGILKEIPGKYMKWKDIKDDYIDQMEDANTKEDWLGKRWRHKFRHIPGIRKSSMIPGKLAYYHREVQKNYNTGKGKGNKLPSNRQRRISSMHSLHTVFQTKYIIEAEEKVMESNLFAFYMKRTMAPIDYVLKAYEGRTNIQKYLAEFTDFLVFKRGKNLSSEATALVDFFTKVNSLAKIAWAPKTSIYNFAIGQSMDIIREPAAWAKGIGRFRHNPKKALNIIGRYGIGTVIDEARFDELAKMSGVKYSWEDKTHSRFTINQIAEKGYVLMDKVEKMNQFPVYIGLMTEDEWNAYDEEGNIIDETKYKHLSPYRRQRLSSIVKSIHGDYRPENAAPFWNTNLGRSLAQFKKWIPAMVWEEIAPYHFDRDYLVHSGIVTSLSMLTRTIRFNISSEQQRADRYMKVITERWPDIEKAEAINVKPLTLVEMKNKIKEDGERKKYVLKNTKDYIDLLISARNGGRINMKSDFSENDKKKLVAAFLQMASFLAISIAIAAIKSGGDDERKFKQIAGSFWLKFLIRYNNDMFMYLQPKQWSNLGDNFGIAYIDAILNMKNFIVDFSTYMYSMGDNFVDTWQEKGFEEAIQHGFWKDEGIYTKDGSMPEKWPKFVKDALGFVPAGGLGKSIISTGMWLGDFRSVVRTMRRKGYSEEIIKQTIETMDESISWRERNRDIAKYEAMIAVKKKALTWRALQNKEITWEVRDIQNYQKELDKILRDNNSYRGYQNMIEENIIDQETIDGYFEDAKKHDKFFGKKKTISPRESHESFEESRKSIQKKNSLRTNPSIYDELKTNR